MSDYVEQLRQLATTKKVGWQQSDCPVVRTATLETTRAWNQVKKLVDMTEAELFKKCELAIQAQAIFRREARSTNQHVAQPKMLSAWLRDGRWDEEIPSHSELKKEVQPSAICSTPGCTDFVHVSGYCTYCYSKKLGDNPHQVDFNTLRAAVMPRHKGEPVSDYLQRCKQRYSGSVGK